MAKDNRKKGCPNTDCKYNKDKVFQKADVNYCPKCGTPLVFVAKADQNMDKIKDGLKKAGQVAGSAAVALGGAVAAKALPQVKKVVVDKGAKVAVEIVKHVIK